MEIMKHAAKRNCSDGQGRFDDGVHFSGQGRSAEDIRRDNRDRCARETTELVFILDRSGSMQGLEADTIGGFNRMIEKQKKLSGIVRVTTVLFDHELKTVHDRVDLTDVAPMDESQYWVRGCTALLDAVGVTVKKVNGRQKTDFSGRPDHTIVVIATDGMENSSKEFSYEKVRSLIERRKRKNGWEFIFMGANMDAVKVASSMGIAADRAATYVNDSQGVAVMYDAADEFVTCMRANAPTAAAGWNRGIESDFAARGK